MVESFKGIVSSGYGSAGVHVDSQWLWQHPQKLCKHKQCHFHMERRGVHAVVHFAKQSFVMDNWCLRESRFSLRVCLPVDYPPSS